MLDDDARVWAADEADRDAEEGDAEEGDAEEGDAEEGDAEEGDAEEGDAHEGDADEGDAHERDERRWRQRAERAEEARRRRERAEAIDFLPFTLREASRSIDAAMRQYLSEDRFAVLSLSAVHVLVLARHSTPIATVAERLRCSPQRVSQLAAALESRGLLDKGDNPLDRRLRLVQTTDAGRELLDELRSRLVVVIGVVADEVGEQRLAALEADLSHLAQVDPRPDAWSLR